MDDPRDRPMHPGFKACNGQGDGVCPRVLSNEKLIFMQCIAEETRSGYLELRHGPRQFVKSGGKGWGPCKNRFLRQHFCKFTGVQSGQWGAITAAAEPDCWSVGVPGVPDGDVDLSVQLHSFWQDRLRARDDCRCRLDRGEGVVQLRCSLRDLWLAVRPFQGSGRRNLCPFLAGGLQKQLMKSLFSNSEDVLRVVEILHAQSF